jgi:hypothetical protein
MSVPIAIVVASVVASMILAAALLITLPYLLDRWTGGVAACNAPAADEITAAGQSHQSLALHCHP